MEHRTANEGGRGRSPGALSHRRRDVVNLFVAVRRGPFAIVLWSVLCVAAATAIGLVLPHNRLGVPAALFLSAVLAASLLGGLGAGVLSTVLGLLALDTLFIPPLYSIGVRSSDDISLAGVFLVAAGGASWLLTRLQNARAHAEREHRRSSAVALMTRALATSSSMEQVGRAVVAVGGPALGAKATGIFLLDREGAELSLLATAGYPEEFERSWVRFPLSAPVPAAEAVRERKQVLLGSIAERAARYGRPRATLRMGPGALAAVPMVAGDGVIGAVTMSFADDHRFGAEDSEFLRVFALQCAQAIERVRLAEDERAVQERLQFLAEASEILSGSLDLDRTLEQVAELAVPRFADWAALDVLTDDGRIQLAAVAHRDAEMVRWARDLRERIPPKLSDETGVGAVIRSGEPQLHSELSPEMLEAQATDPLQQEVIRRLSPRSVILAPLITQGKVLGAMTLIESESDRRYTAEDLALVEDLARRAATAIDNARLHGAQLEAREELEAAEGRLRILADASRILGGSLDLDATLERVARLAVDHVADSAIVYLDRDGSGLRSAAIAHVDPAKRALLERLEHVYQPSANESSHVLRAFRSGELQSMERIDASELAATVDPEVAALVAELGVSSGLAVPLAAGARTIGALALGWTDPRRISDADGQLVSELASRMARAIENATLFSSERTARAEAERASDRLRVVSRTVELLSESLEYPAVFQRLAGVVVEELADLCLIDVLEPSGTLQRVAAAHADPAKQPLADRLLRDYAPRTEGMHPVSRVIRTGVPEFAAEMPEEFLRSTTNDDEHFRIVMDLGFQSFMCAPLSARGRILGTMTFVSCRPERRYDATDLSLALDIARPAAVRIDNARLFSERDQVARSLQEILLPESLPTVAGFELAAMYRPGREGMEVGGDFYDVFRRPDGSLGLVIGDVCGHGPDAAAVMGLARQTVRVAGMSDSRPSAILRVVNEVLLQGAYERFATACDVRVIPQSSGGRIVVCSAGHPLPMVIRVDGRVETAGRHGSLLGVTDDVELFDVPMDIHPGDALVLFTDGLIEWPSHPEVDGSLRELLSSLACRPAADIVAALEAWWLEGTGGRGPDDAAVLVLRAVQGGEGPDTTLFDQ